MSRYQVAGDLINRTAVSVGLNKVADPFANSDPAFIQLVELANQLGEDLLDQYAWQILNRSHAFVTVPGDDGDYPLPVDFAYMLDQTGWQQGGVNGSYPLLGPATSQVWSYLEALRLYDVTIYAYFWQNEGLFKLFPRPIVAAYPVSYRYISNYWVAQTNDVEAPRQASLTAYSNVVLYDPLLFIRGLKLQFLQAKGFETTKAEDDFLSTFDSITGHDKPAPVLSMTNRSGFALRLLNGYDNVPETGYGL
jgi:hypothetical protein